MTVDPGLIPLMTSAAVAVDGIRGDVVATASSAATSQVPGWQGSAATAHAQDLARLQDLVLRAAACLGTLEQELAAGAVQGAQAVAAQQQAAATAAASGAQGAGAPGGTPTSADPVWGPTSWT